MPNDVLTEQQNDRDRPSLRLPLVLATAAAVIAGSFLGARALASWVADVGGPSAPEVEAGLAVDIEVVEGATARQIADVLVRAGVVFSRRDFEEAITAAGAAGELKAGTYSLETGMNPVAVVAALVSGPPIATSWITIPEGLRASEILTRLADQTPHEVAEFEAALRAGAVRSPLSPVAASGDLEGWEGLLFPDTYQVNEDASSVEILQLLADTMNARFEAISWSHSEVSQLSPLQQLTVASIIEAETRVDSDRPLVARVIYNRVAAEMPLQIDATVLYALGVRGRHPTATDLETDSPYNTYRNVGLPPGPIAAPGAASLRAAAQPADGDYLYYVLTAADGSHSFTADFEEFQRWAAEAREQGLF